MKEFNTEFSERKMKKFNIEFFADPMYTVEAETEEEAIELATEMYYEYIPDVKVYRTR